MKLLPFYPDIADSTKISSFADFIANAKNLYLTYVTKGSVKRMEKECFIVYRIKNINGSFSGIVALNSYDDYENILGHEKTLIQKEDDHINSMKNLKSMIKPVLIGYEKNAAIEDFISSIMTEEPTFSFFDTEQQESHDLWLCEDFYKIQRMFDQYVDTCFIADGHHRYAMSKYLKDNKLIEGAAFKGLLCYYMSFDQLKIYAYNRLLNLGTMTFSTLLKKLEAIGTVTALPMLRQPSHKHEIILENREGCYSFQWHEEYTKADSEMVFDVDLFNSYILEDIFNIEDARLLGNSNFIEGTISIGEIEDRIKKKKEVAFIFYPIQPEELIQNALDGNYLPPKSTWFYPRIKSGVINCTF